MADADLIRDFVIAGHGNLARVSALLDAHPELLNAAQPWSETDHETAIQAASHVGNVAIAELLLSRGAPLAIYTAAMLGRRAEVEALVASDPRAVHTLGAHGIPLLPHAALSGDAALFAYLVGQGADAGISFALHSAAAGGHVELARWILAHGQPDLSWTNYQGKTALQAAEENGQTEIAALLRSSLEA